MSIAVLTEEILSVREIEGVTISGGEPMEQAPALVSLVDSVRRTRDFGVIVYTGFCVEDLKIMANQENSYADLLCRTDLLIDGPYLAAHDDGLSLRGSNNQRVIALSRRYAQVIHHYYGVPGRKIEVFCAENELCYAGIPSAAFLTEWKQRYTEEDV